MASFKFENVYLKEHYTLVGPLEKDSRLKNFDEFFSDYYFGEKTFEQAEIKIQRSVIDNLLLKSKLKLTDLDFIIGGDLINQISITSYALRHYDIPYLGIYSACATFSEGLIIGGQFLENNNFKNIMNITSSHNLTAERQYRYPIEYGNPRPHTATFTATGGVGAVITNEKSKIKIESATIGRTVDLGIKDVNNTGAVMAPAAANTLKKHLDDMKRNIEYYDIILTGDLGCVGANIFKEYCKKGFNLRIKKYMDAGCELFLKSQDTYAGGSGPVCLPLILFTKILKNSNYKKILIIGTGALHSINLVNQHNTIPGIAHAVSLEVLS